MYVTIERLEFMQLLQPRGNKEELTEYQSHKSTENEDRDHHSPFDNIGRMRHRFIDSKINWLFYFDSLSITFEILC